MSEPIKAVPVQQVVVTKALPKVLVVTVRKYIWLFDAHGNPLEFIVGDGVTHDVKIALALLELLDFKDTEFLNADKGYDSEAFRELIHLRGAHANIP